MSEEQVQTQFPSTVATPASARAFLRSALQTWNLDGFGQVTELLTDELVSNVVRHVGEPMTLRATRLDDRIRIEVDDPSTEPPVLLPPNHDSVTGRGIALVDALAVEWGADLHDDGKTVWFEIDLTTATEEIHGGD